MSHFTADVAMKQQALVFRNAVFVCAAAGRFASGQL
jgi:hypothetical protein